MKHSIIPFLAFLFCLCCVKQEISYDLQDEAKYALAKEDFFFIDYLKEESNIYLEKGWSRLNKDGYRLGAYLGSQLNFTLSENRPLFLFILCNPIREGRYPAKKLHIEINGLELEQVDFREKMQRYIKILIPSESLKTGENTIEFIYLVDKLSKEEADPSLGDKREFSLVFHELFLTSLASYGNIKKFLEAEKHITEKYEDAFIQKIPGEMDFYLDLRYQSSLKAQYKFLPFGQNKSSKKELDLQISIQKSEEEEQIIYFSSIEEDPLEKKIKIDLPDVTGLARFRLKTQDRQNQNTPAGFLIWTEASMKKEREQKKRDSGSDKIQAELRASLTDKNTIIIILDAARADHFSNYGYFRPTTPNISLFAEEASVFSNAFSEALTTRCSIGTLFTGYPLPITSFMDIHSILPEELTTLAQLFQSQGFKTTGYTGVGNIGSAFDFHRGFDEYFELYREDGFRRKSQEYIPYLFPWLEANRKKSFFLYIHFKEPHAIYIPLPPFRGMFSDHVGKKTDLVEYVHNADSLTEEEIEYIRACYDESLASADSVFGELTKKLEELDLLENSIIFLTSDHGEFLGETNRIFGHGGFFGDKGIHIPLFIRFPKDSAIKTPRKIEGLVKMSDLFVTLADIYQFKIPQELHEGKSLLPLLLDPEGEANPYVVIGKQGYPGYCYRTKQHKLIYWEESGFVEFFDLEKDPKEKNEIYTRDNIRANFMLANLKKWLNKQRLIKEILLMDDPSKKELDLKNIDKKTLENLKALGYIK